MSFPSDLCCTTYRLLIQCTACYLQRLGAVRYLGWRKGSPPLCLYLTLVDHRLAGWTDMRSKALPAE